LIQTLPWGLRASILGPASSSSSRPMAKAWLIRSQTRASEPSGGNPRTGRRCASLRISRPERYPGFTGLPMANRCGSIVSKAASMSSPCAIHIVETSDLSRAIIRSLLASYENSQAPQALERLHHPKSKSRLNTQIPKPAYVCTCGLCAGFFTCGGGPFTTLTSNSTGSSLGG
jgi:hypothetical protein